MKLDIYLHLPVPFSPSLLPTSRYPTTTSLSSTSPPPFYASYWLICISSTSPPRPPTPIHLSPVNLLLLAAFKGNSMKGSPARNIRRRGGACGGDEAVKSLALMCRHLVLCASSPPPLSVAAGVKRRLCRFILGSDSGDSMWWRSCFFVRCADLYYARRRSVCQLEGNSLQHNVDRPETNIYNRLKSQIYPLAFCTADARRFQKNQLNFRSLPSTLALIQSHTLDATCAFLYCRASASR